MAGQVKPIPVPVILAAVNGDEDALAAVEYYGAAEPPVRCGESHLSGLTEPLRSL